MSTAYAKYSGLVSGSSGSSGVTSLNSLTGAVTLAAGSNVTLTPSGNTITIASSGGGGGANTALSNLASVAINQSLVPGTTNSKTLGDATHQWEGLYLHTGIFTGGSSSPCVDVNQLFLSVGDGNARVNWNSQQLIDELGILSVNWKDHKLSDNTSVESINYAGRYLANSAGTNCFDWSTTGTLSTSTTVLSAETHLTIETGNGTPGSLALEYVPSTAGDWAGSPTDVASALDRLAAAVAGLLGNPIP